MTIYIIRKFQTKLFWYGFLIVALTPWNPASCSSILCFWGNGFSRGSLSSAVIFGAVFLWFFLTIHIRVRRSLSDGYRFLPEFCFCEEICPSFPYTVITFETVLLATPNKSLVYVTLAPGIRATTIWPLLKFAILMNFDLFIQMISV